jgi:hypothetical protein
MKRQIPFVLVGGLALTGVVLGIVAKVFFFASGIYQDRYVDGRFIPMQGLRLNPHDLSNLTHEAAEDFEVLNKAMQAYTKKFGKFPDTMDALEEFSKDWPENERVTAETYRGEDYELTDDYIPSPEGSNYRWHFLASRVDGSKRPVFPRNGERDVWFSTDEFVRSGRTVYRDGSMVEKPEGFYLVMWSDGLVEEVPLSKLVYVRSSSGGEESFFLDEVGVASKLPRPAWIAEKRTKWWPAASMAKSND